MTVEAVETVEGWDAARAVRGVWTTLVPTIQANGVR
jgi:hypothetical protein